MGKQEGYELPVTEAQQQQTVTAFSSRRRRFLVAALIVTALVSLNSVLQSTTPAHHTIKPAYASKPVDACPQAEPYADVIPLPASPAPLELAHLLSGAVRVNTSVYDGTPPVSSAPEVWEATFAPLAAYLERAFPRIHAEDSPVTLEKVNAHGLLYTWQGSEAELKPLLFTAHQDVVPVDAGSAKRWTHAPFGGDVDEELGLVWGRGSSDDKASLVMLMSALETLVATDLVPNRTIILGFGFDEESAGTEGGLALATFLEARYGRHDQGKGIAMLVDEGEEFVQESVYGYAYANPAVAEKGYLDVALSVRTPGGHSSSPPKRTGIGHLARLVALLEDNPPEPSLRLAEDFDGATDSPALAELLCVRDAPKLTKSPLGKALEKLVATRASLKHVRCAAKRAKLLDAARRAVLGALSKEQAEAFGTTQAADLISGGVKINALPELATATINYRIDAISSTAELRKRLEKLVAPYAKSHGLELDAWSGDEEAASEHKPASWKGTVELRDAFNSALEASPITPSTIEDKTWRLFAGVVRRTWGVKGPHGKEQGILLSPSLMQGNTDTKSYWNLTQHIFRMSPSSLLPNRSPDGDSNVHTVDENATIDSLVKAHEWYMRLMLAAQEPDSL